MVKLELESARVSCGACVIPFISQCIDELVEGCNAVRVLEELGLAKDVAAKSESTSSNKDGNGHYAFMGSFKYVDSRSLCWGR